MAQYGPKGRPHMVKIVQARTSQANIAQTYEWFWSLRKRTGTQKHWRPGFESVTWSFSEEVGWNIFCSFPCLLSPKASRSFIKNKNASSCFWRYEPFFKHNISFCLSRVYISTNTIIELLTKCEIFCWPLHNYGVKKPVFSYDWGPCPRRYHGAQPGRSPWHRRQSWRGRRRTPVSCGSGKAGDEVQSWPRRWRNPRRGRRLLRCRSPPGDSWMSWASRWVVLIRVLIF